MGGGKARGLSEGERAREKRGKGGDEEEGRVRPPNKKPAFATALNLTSYGAVYVHFYYPNIQGGPKK